MVKKDVIAYGAFIGRRAARPQIVILLPQVRSLPLSLYISPLTDGHPSCMQEEKLNEAGVQELPPGFHLCQLPFADDIRTLGIGKTLTCVQREHSRCCHHHGIFAD